MKLDEEDALVISLQKRRIAKSPSLKILQRVRRWRK